jgi:hypothetical protein
MSEAMKTEGPIRQFTGGECPEVFIATLNA